MDAETHNRYLAYAHFGYAGFQLLWGLLVFGIMAVALTAERGPVGPPPFVMGLIFAVVLLMQLLFALPSAVAGYGLLKRRSWARVAAIIAGAAAGVSVPLGTALCVYTFWFLFGETGKRYHDPDERPAMRPVASLFGPPEAHETPRERDRAHSRPYEPPDWRD